MNDEIEFIISIFVENGYDRKLLENIVNNQKKPTQKKKQDNRKKYVSLPWIPGLSKKLKKSFKNAGYTVSFKSPKNLQQILTTRNKPQLPPNSRPGVYLAQCECEAKYTGRTKKKVSTRKKEHERAVFLEDTEKSALAEHAKTCSHNIRWSDIKTLSVENNFFKR